MICIHPVHLQIGRDIPRSSDRQSSQAFHLAAGPLWRLRRRGSLATQRNESASPGLWRADRVFAYGPVPPPGRVGPGRLKLIELRRLSGTDFQDGLLYQEAVCQAVLGERRCPRETAFAAFLAQSMRSIASHRRAELARQVPITREDLSGNPIDLPIEANQLDPEEILIEREAANVVAEIYELLESDDEAQLTIMAIADGKKGKELRDELGIDQARFDYIMKRIRRVLAKKYPKGWPS